MMFKLKGVEYAEDSMEYLEGSHGLSRCRWCHESETHSSNITPHKSNCPYHTIVALRLALAQTSDEVEKLNKLIPHQGEDRVIKWGNEFYIVSDEMASHFTQFMESPERGMDVSIEAKQVALQAVGAIVKLFGRKVYSGSFDHDAWFQSLHGVKMVVIPENAKRVK